jgi:prolipoprotein diacylglyceryltransferase
MDAIWSSLGAIPWYGWVVIVAIVGGALVAVAKAKSKRPA